MSISKNELKKISSLNRKSKRKEHGLFIVEGEKNCKELIESNYEVVVILATSKVVSLFPGAIECSKKELERISNLKNTSDVIAVSKIPKDLNYENDDKPIIYLDNINDPGNLGSIIRSLDWFGFKHVFCSDNTVDQYNNKTIMASMGSIFRIQAHYINYQDFRKKFSKYTLFISSINGNNIEEIQLKKKAIMVIGSESNGVSDEIKNNNHQAVKIPGMGKAESLNAGVATGIILHEMVKKLTFESK
jgi:TrmH family RNA methyltransferase